MIKSLRLTETRTDNIPLAVGVIVLTVFALSLGDGLIKRASAGTLVIWQMFVLRSALAIPPLLLAIRIAYPTRLALPRAPGWTTLRSLMLVAMWVAYYLALPHLQLSLAAAAFYTAPLFIVLLAAVFTGDRIRPVGWVAVGLGFIGIILILRPRAGDFNAFALLPIASALLYALAMILTRTKCRSEHPLVLSLALNFAFVVVGGGVSVVAVIGQSAVQWAPLGMADWALLAMLAVAILIGSAGAAVAYQNAPAALVGTFDFAYVGFAVVWGLVLFGDLPGPQSIVGIALIVAAGVLSVRK